MSSAAYQYPNPQQIFFQQYESVRRDEVVGILLALFLGTFGVHHFYLRRTGLGILYCCFFWTGITSILGLIECFFMPGRVREFNAIQAAGIAAALWISPRAWSGATRFSPVSTPPASGLSSAVLGTRPVATNRSEPSIVCDWPSSSRMMPPLARVTL